LNRIQRTFWADPDVIKLLEKVPNRKRSDFINEAIRDTKTPSARQKKRVRELIEEALKDA